MPKFRVEAKITRSVVGIVDADDESDASTRAQGDDWDEVESETLEDGVVDSVEEIE